MSLLRLRALALLLLVSSALAPLRASATYCSELGASDPNVFVCDAADNPVYADVFGWGLDDQGELGFPAFGTWDFGGAATRTVADGPDWLDTNDLSWEIATTSTGLAYARFQSPLEIGDTLRLRWSAEDLLDGERIGVSLHSGSNCQGALFAVEREGSCAICPKTRLTDATRTDEFVPFGVYEASEFAFTLTDSTNYQLQIGEQGLPADVLAGTIAATPHGVCLRVKAAGTERVGYFNRITVTIAAPEPLAGLCATAAWIALASIARARRDR